MDKKSSSSVFWSSKLAFILAAAGSAIGLGNIWRFPYLVAKHGGGTFIVTYLIFAFFIGAAVLLAEFAIGRYLGHPMLRDLKEKTNGIISKIVRTNLLIPFVILSFYFVVAGWTLYYFANTVFGVIEYNTNDAQYYANIFTSLLNDPFTLIIYTFIFIALTMFINFKGVIAGIEKANLFLLPLLFVILTIMIVRSLTLDGAMEGVKFYFSFDIAKINNTMIIDALGQAFFSLSIGVGIMLVFGSFVKKDFNLANSAISTALLGAVLGLFSAMIIIPAAYAFNFDINSGPGLTFITLPAIFAHLKFGVIFASLFFITMAFAALTSTISLVEPTLTFVMDIFKTTRNKAIAILTVAYFIASSIQALSFNLLGNIKVNNKNIFDMTDFSVNILIILGALNICIIIGYIISKNIIKTEVTNENKVSLNIFSTWFYAMKYIIPMVMVVILVNYIYLNI